MKAKHKPLPVLILERCTYGAWPDVTPGYKGRVDVSDDDYYYARVAYDVRGLYVIQVSLYEASKEDSTKAYQKAQYTSWANTADQLRSELKRITGIRDVILDGMKERE